MHTICFAHALTALKLESAFRVHVRGRSGLAELQVQALQGAVGRADSHAPRTQRWSTCRDSDSCLVKTLVRADSTCQDSCLDIFDNLLLKKQTWRPRLEEITRPVGANRLTAPAGSSVHNAREPHPARRCIPPDCPPPARRAYYPTAPPGPSVSTS